ncbi:uncharacterized protein LOC126884972 [Diabrotica virgifera virgifera]|uniref:Uncharacterized protein LOC114343255 n=1 Tax=Diabrotica virgifera virgifera TaxID=50390 RepID=A0A6P7GIW8_DIAVI|nr:uncharacterized protein LOC126884972 [Diabrotica virgifera virgifera]
MKFIVLLFLVAAVNARFGSQDDLAVLASVDRPNRPFRLSDCLLHADSDPCSGNGRDTYPVWKWDIFLRSCVRASARSSCTPTHNNFPTHEACSKLAGIICRKLRSLFY